MNASNNIFVVTLIVFLSGCCVLKQPIQKRECQIQRANDKIVVLTAKFPELLQANDTIWIRDTITIEALRVDTTFIDRFENDTIIIENERLKIQYIKRDSIIYLTGECKTDTIFINRDIPIDRIVVETPTLGDQLKSLTWLILVVLFGLLILRKFGKDLFSFLK